MKTSLRFLLLLVATITVGALGYYAYTLHVRTLVYALNSTEVQKGNQINIVFDKPLVTALTSHEVRPLTVDERALKNALLLDGKPLIDTGSVSIDYPTTNSLSITLKDLNTDKKQILTLKASLYNQATGVAYRLPADINLETTSSNPDIVARTVGTPRDKKYSIDLLGFPKGVDANMVTLYQVPKDASGSSCMIDAVDYAHPVKYDTLALYDSEVKDTLDIVSSHTIQGSYCLYAGLSGKLYEIDNRTVNTFTLTGSAIDILAPEYDMQSRLQFDFSNPLFEDIGVTNSQEYIAERTKQKELFLKHLSITPELPLTIDDIVMTPDRTVITLPLNAGMEYSVKLDDVEDIYGQLASMKLSLTPKREPYLSLALSGHTTTLPVSTPVWAKMYALDTKRSSHNVMLCKVGVEMYARFERIVDENKKEYSDEMFDTFAKLPKNSCTTKEILTEKNNLLSKIEVASFFPGKKQTPGLYILAFADHGDAIYTSKWLRPVLFSLLDTHITMKLDASGKALFFATDMTTSMPIAGQEIRIFKNIGRTYNEVWNPTTEKIDITYLPLSTITYATGITLGRTDKDGFLSVDMKDLLDGESAYGFTFESWWGYQGEYRSFLVESRGEGGRLGYVVSTWNDGIAGWNFGFKEEDYGWSSMSSNLSYTHTDRRLYIPGDTVNIHSIIREYTDKLSIPPPDRTYAIAISDPNGKEVSQVLLKASEFGSLSDTWKLPTDAPLGMYTAQVTISDKKLGDLPIDGGYTDFQVEIFKNPTFTSQVSVSSPDVSAEIISNLRKKPNTDSNTYWYDSVYEGTFNLDAKIKAAYYNGATVRNVPFTYRVYRSEYWGGSKWNNCFWGCYYEPPLDFYTEGEGRIDADGYGLVRVPVLFSSFYSDFKYTVEVTIQDPLTSETVTSAGNMIVRLPTEYRMWDSSNPLDFKPEKKILSTEDILTGVFEPARGTWSKWHENKYEYALSLRTYTMTQVEDIRGGKSEVMHPEDTVVSSGSITSEKWSFSMKGKPSGEYHILVQPKGLTATGSERISATSDTTVYYVGADKNAKNPRFANNAISVIAEKTVYHLGDTARILVRLPWEKSKILLTLEKNGVLEKKYIDGTGNLFEYTFTVDDRFVPNAYVGVVAFAPSNTKSPLPEYRVGYTEIVTDMTDKKASLAISTDKKEYKTGENVHLNLALADSKGKPLTGEVALMVVDESLISLLGNIDLDVIPKFYQKLPFSMRTALSLIGMEERRYFSRNGVAGGSGGKGGDGSALSTRTRFENTAYYNPSILTDSSGRANLSFPLPDNITNYRIIAIANTKSSQFGVSESTVSVRKDYVIELHAPTIVRRGDSFTISVNIFNSTDRITPARLTLKIDGTIFTGSLVSEVKLQPKSPENITYTLRNISDATSGKIPFTLTLSDGKNTLDSITSYITIVSDPLFETRSVHFYELTGSTLILPLEHPKTNIDSLKSKHAVDVSTSILSSYRHIFRTLLEYPYGCVEQTTSSTIPNAIALAVESVFPTGIKKEDALHNIAVGIDRLRTMQLPSGGFAYWAGETTENTMITPYVLRSLLTMRNLGATVPSDMIEIGTQYLIENEGLYLDANAQAERFWTLAMAKSPEAQKAKKNIDTSKLTLHGWVAYLYGLELIKSLTPQLIQSFEDRYLSKKIVPEENYWYYWTRGADMMTFARLLLDHGEKRDIVFNQFLRDSLSDDWSSYYYSTQEKLQTFLTLTKYLQLEGTVPGSIKVSMKTGVLKTEGILSSRDNFMERNFELFRSGESLSFEKNNPRTLYVTMTDTFIPKDPYIVPLKNDAGVSVSRTIEKIDEKLGVDSDGTFISTTPVNNGVFGKGSLYRVTLSVKIPKYKDKPWTDFAIEDYLPGGWHPISSNFLTSSSVLSTNTNGESQWSWSHVESQLDRILAHAANGYGDTMKYEYFIRPEQGGTYLLPPVTAYFMYHPEMRGYGTYQKVIVK